MINNINNQVDKLLLKMSLREKLGQIVQIETHRLMREPWDDLMPEDEWLKIENNLNQQAIHKVLVEYNIGSIMSGGSAAPRSTVEGWVELIGTIKENCSKTRLNIPIMYGLDAVHGFNYIIGGTVFPHNLAVAATWNPNIARLQGEITAKQISSVGVDLNYAPCLDVARDPRWGRTYETLGEDPYLASEIGKGFVEGIQSTNEVMACAKHFIGCSSSANGKDRGPVDISERSLKEIHIPPFKSAIDAGLGMIMISSVEVNGVPALISKWLIKDILRGELGFEGIITSDWGDVIKLYDYHKVCPTMEEALIKTINTGVDMIMAPVDLNYVDLLEQNVNNGRIPLSRIDDAVRRILKAKFQFNMFNKETCDIIKARETILSEEAKNAALTAARESTVLLKNEASLLPLSKDIESVLIVGEAANCRRHLCSGWTMVWQGAKEEELISGETILDAVKSRVSSGTKIEFIENYSDKKKIEEAAEKAKVCIFVISEQPYAEWFGDVQSLQLPEEQFEALRFVHACDIPIITVLISGRPLNISWVAHNVNSLLWSCFPGTEGGSAIGDVIFGDYNPSGRLPVTFPKDDSQLPCVYNSRINTRYEPLYPFGYGLSYTEFEYSDLMLPDSVWENQQFEVSVKVKNTGSISGEVNVQLYLHDSYISVTRPEKQLLAFDKVFLEQGEEKKVSFNILSEQLCTLDENMELVLEPRVIELQIGDKTGRIQIQNCPQKL